MKIINRVIWSILGVIAFVSAIFLVAKGLVSLTGPIKTNSRLGVITATPTSFKVVCPPDSWLAGFLVSLDDNIMRTTQEISFVVKHEGRAVAESTFRVDELRPTNWLPINLGVGYLIPLTNVVADSTWRDSLQDGAVLEVVVSQENTASNVVVWARFVDDRLIKF